MNNIVTASYVDANGNYQTGGCQINVTCDAVVKGPELIATADYDGLCTLFPSVSAGDVVEASHPVAKISALVILDKTRGRLIINETMSTFGAKCAACCIPE